MRHMTLLPLLALLTGAAAAQHEAPTVTPVAIELFTSQGCSSCPPADALVERLSTEPNIIILTRPVTYWDRLGWKDTLAREENTELQHAYARRGGDGAGVYTPQAVVQGDRAVVGSREQQLRGLVAQEKTRKGPRIRALATPGGGRLVEIDQDIRADASVSLVALKHKATVRIGSGENGGRTVRYTNVVLAEQKVGRWTGGHLNLTLDATLFRTRGADRHALLLRQGNAGRIVAVRYI